MGSKTGKITSTGGFMSNFNGGERNEISFNINSAKMVRAYRKW